MEKHCPTMEQLHAACAWLLIMLKPQSHVRSVKLHYITPYVSLNSLYTRVLSGQAKYDRTRASCQMDAIVRHGMRTGVQTIIHKGRTRLQRTHADQVLSVASLADRAVRSQTDPNVQRTQPTHSRSGGRDASTPHCTQPVSDISLQQKTLSVQLSDLTIKLTDRIIQEPRTIPKAVFCPKAIWSMTISAFDRGHIDCAALTLTLYLDLWLDL